MALSDVEGAGAFAVGVLFGTFLTTGSKKLSVGSLSLPTNCMRAELFLASKMLFSLSERQILCSPVQWLTKEVAKPKLSLQTKHIRMGLTGTVEYSSKGGSASLLHSCLSEYTL